MKFWREKLSLIIFAAAVLGYLTAIVVASPQWLIEPYPALYEIILLCKSVFFAALKMLVAPVVFFSLFGGLLQIAEVGQLGKMGKYTIIYYLSTTFIAILIGLFVVFFVHPWEEQGKTAGLVGQGGGISISKPTVEDQASTTNYIQLQNSDLEKHVKGPQAPIAKGDESVVRVVSKLLKRAFVNPVDAFVSNNVLGIVFWAMALGLAFIAIRPKESTIPKFVAEANHSLAQVLTWVILFAPIGVFAIAFDFQLKFSGTIVSQLISFCLVVFGATAFHGFVVLPLIAKYFGGVGFRELMTKASKALVLALSTSSSSATLPVSMSVCRREFNIKESVAGFVLPLGATMNMDGTALFEGIAAVFLAYIFGIELSSVAMVSIFFMAMISSIGAPGMPSGSMSGMQMVLIAAGIPLEGIGLLLVVERALDTFRTAVNVEGDIVGAIVVAKKVS